MPERGVAAAVRAKPVMAAMPGYKRAELLRRVAGLLNERVDRIAEVMSRETGTTVSRIGGPRQDVATVADAIARAIEHPVPEVFPHFQSRALIWANTFAPGFTDRLVKRFGRKPLHGEHPADPQ